MDSGHQPNMQFSDTSPAAVQGGSVAAPTIVISGSQHGIYNTASGGQQIVIGAATGASIPEVKTEPDINMLYDNGYGSSTGSSTSYTYGNSNPDSAGFALSDFLVQLEDYTPTVPFSF